MAVVAGSIIGRTTQPSFTIISDKHPIPPRPRGLTTPGLKLKNHRYVRVLEMETDVNILRGYS